MLCVGCVSQCVCSLLQCVAVCCKGLQYFCSVLQCAAVCCSGISKLLRVHLEVMSYVFAVGCSALPCVAVRCRVYAVCRSVMPCVCSMLQCV